MKIQSSSAFCAFLVIDYLRSIAGTAVTIYGEHGTEKLDIAGLQFFFSNNSIGFMFEHSAASHVNKLRTKILYLYSSYLKCCKGTLCSLIHRSGLITHLPQQRIDYI